MTDLILAICSSAAISLIMRLSTGKIANNVSMLAVNYLTCLGLAAFFTGGGFFPKDGALPGALGMGIVHAQQEGLAQHPVRIVAHASADTHQHRLQQI